jgi:hypothetical protein
VSIAPELVVRYRALLAAYPARHRAAWRDEMLSTLLETARPGQRWPAPRESWFLVTEGLRCRAGTSTGRPMRVVVAGGLRIGLLLVLAGLVFENTAMLARPWHVPHLGSMAPPGRTAVWYLLAALAVLIGAVPFVLLVRGSIQLAAPFVPLAVLVGAVGYPALAAYPSIGWLTLRLQHHVLVYGAGAMVAMAAVWWLRGPVARPLPWPVVAGTVLPWILWVAPAWLLTAGVTFEVEPFDPVALVNRIVWGLVFLAVVGYTVIDARPAIAAVFILVLAGMEGLVAAFVGPMHIVLPIAQLIAVLVAVLAVAGWFGIRRQGRPAG